MQLFEVSIGYSRSEESDLEAFLSALENDIGAKRTPYFAKTGALDLVSFLVVSAIFVAGIEFIASSREFNRLFRPAVEDELKFLVSPFRSPEL